MLFDLRPTLLADMVRPRQSSLFIATDTQRTNRKKEGVFWSLAFTAGLVGPSLLRAHSDACETSRDLSQARWDPSSALATLSLVRSGVSASTM